MKAIVLAYAAADAASTTYRYSACQGFWAAEGHRLEIAGVRNVPPDFWRGLGAYDAIINQKALLPRRLARRIFNAGKPVFFDFDDAIWTRPRRPYSWWTQWRVNHRIRYWLRRVQRVFAANEHLAAYARRHNPQVTVVPMGLDLETWRPRTERADGAIRIGWSGSPGNLWHLERLCDVLRRVVQSNPAGRLTVLCGQRPDFSFPFEHVPFVPRREAEFVRGLDIGLLPLQSDPYTMGKSPIKALQYLSCAVPVVGNIRGATAEFLNAENSIAVETDEEWVTALQRLFECPSERLRLGQAGRRFVEQHHDLRRVSRQLLELLRGC